jgi:hypothetical protein
MSRKAAMRLPDWKRVSYVAPQLALPGMLCGDASGLVHYRDCWDFFVWLLDVAVSDILRFWPISLGLLLAAGATAVFAGRRPRPFLQASAFAQLAPLAVFAGILLVGTWSVCRVVDPVSHLWAIRATFALLAMQVLGSLWLIRVASSWRVSAALLQALLLWWSLSAMAAANHGGPFL